jgi:hypothetical protein
MSTTFATAAALQSTEALINPTAQGVLQNDTGTPRTINLNQLGVPVTVSVEQPSVANTEDSADTVASASATANAVAPKGTAPKLVNMEQARISWERTELAASNKRLYSILGDAYSFYLAMKQDSSKVVRMARTDEMEKFINAYFSDGGH